MAELFVLREDNILPYGATRSFCRGGYQPPAFDRLFTFVEIYGIIQPIDKLEFEEVIKMLAYSIIMFLIAALFTGLGIAIYRGKTDLIHDYHQTKVTDKAAYGKAFGKAMFVIVIALLFSSIIGFFDNLAMLAVAVLIIGVVIGIGCIIAVQIKYNKGVF